MSDFEKWWEEEGQERASLDGCAYHVAKIAWENGAYKAEKERDELKKIISHGNGEILLGWMDAHRKAMDRLDKAEEKN